MTFSPGDPNAAARNSALNHRIGAALNAPTGTKRSRTSRLSSPVPGSRSTRQGSPSADREPARRHARADQGVPTEEVGARILALQTRLQASLQTTSLLYQTSLVNYI